MTRVPVRMLFLAPVLVSALACGSSAEKSSDAASVDTAAASAPAGTTGAAPAPAPAVPAAAAPAPASAPAAAPARNPAPAAAAPPPAPDPPPPPPPPPPITVPAGTVVNVRLTADVNVDTAQTGATIKGIVDDPVMVAGEIAIPREARATIGIVNVQQSGKLKGADAIQMKLNSVAFGGQSHQLATEYASVQGKGEGKKTTRKIAGGAGLGAIVGGIAGGGKGAAIGAAVGGGTGAAVSAGKSESLVLPAETRLQFKLSSAVNIEQ